MRLQLATVTEVFEEIDHAVATAIAAEMYEPPRKKGKPAPGDSDGPSKGAGKASATEPVAMEGRKTDQPAPAPAPDNHNLLQDDKKKRQGHGRG